jgi:outer membrane protein OmpA-like peptidoglycan-associated protein
MNTSIRTHSKKLLAVAIAAVLLTACSAAPQKPAGAAAARAKLTQLQSDSQLASLAPVAIKDADAAVNAAEQPQKDVELGKHLVFIADRKVDTAAAQAQGSFLEAQRKTLSEQRETARLDSRTREADLAHSDAASSKQQVGDLQKQLDDLNAKTTDRGIVVTLGDVLFDTGRAELKGGAVSNLARLAAFLNQYQDRTVAIEGHTDSVGSEESNLGLSQRRADSVKSYLVHQGVGTLRLTSAGMGEDTPIASNESAAGRQQNRRVEVIIANPTTASK